MTESDALTVEPLGKRHDRTAFSCGLPELDRYLARQAGQDVRRRIPRTFVCTTGEADAILGFYTLSARTIDQVMDDLLGPPGIQPRFVITLTGYRLHSMSVS